MWSMFLCMYIGSGFTFECLTLGEFLLDIVFSYLPFVVWCRFSRCLSVIKQSAKMLNLFFMWMSGFIISIPSILLIFDWTDVESESDVDRLRVVRIFIFSSFNFRFPWSWFFGNFTGLVYGYIVVQTILNWVISSSCWY